MAKISEAVTLINASLSSGALKSSRFQEGTLYGLATIEVVNSTEPQTKPLLVDDLGVVTQDTVIDDNLPFQLYHRINGNITSTPLPESSNGDLININEQTTPMVMIVTYSKPAIQLREEDIIAGITASMPTNLSITDVDYTEIEVGDSNTNRTEVWNQEHDQEFNLSQEYGMISIEYQILQHIDDRCFILCV